MLRDVVSVLFLLFLLAPVSAELVIVSPSTSTYSTYLVNDYTNGPEGEVVFATSTGLTFYNGTWTTYHTPPAFRKDTLISDFILSIAYGPDGMLWIGTPAGLQRMNGPVFETVAGQEHLKNPIVIGLQRWDDALWIETSNAGVHRLENGSWTWFKPFSGGPQTYALDDIVLDPASGTLYCISQVDGVFAIGEDASAGFNPVMPGGRRVTGFTGAVTDPFGGVYLFNRSCVAHLDGDGLETAIVSAGDLGIFVGEINDVSPAPDGSLWVATDHGLFQWKDGSVLDNVYRAHGIWSNVIKSVFVDSTGRCWFSTPTAIGYYYPDNATQGRLHFNFEGIFKRYEGAPQFSL
ncbi:two-component regulator propeller domain-containing protein [uncultured Methanofollis sp.]|uniref:two-component regulator propeller domain-containing protein n=1 Tax=uncultured Methanofollis sp. TaxID=262500 RepID=UPI0026042167|nr:two-component regulator propeller domain-containing protein [uncultured Methanofollis sp.]